MRRHFKITLLISIFILAFSFFLFLKFNEDKNQAQLKNFKKQVGTYVLDMRRTSLGPYQKDSSKYKNLQITFRMDSSFIMNMKVPFFFDSIGRWNPAGGGLEDWGWVYYQSWGYDEYKENTGNQFAPPWISDSVFYFNGATPQKGEFGIQQIYFMKKFD